ncbi:tafazzin family protein [Cavenderia fasciculata]|uniref:Tafazzin family protein n=1 Tax=Cavenderia fasciculata TaxID=261658 RepID=F4PHF2_CACFS|nr:tafazzin family protein [Cavenderia fasciculata]EGG25136.1 tafazzin family protein [Cavenderia fasciculata]|eukprot:XP_004362987.1 tafazzin family protein [Cavenderia fasciculata]
MKRIVNNPIFVPQPKTLSKLAFTTVGLTCKAWSSLNLWKIHGQKHFESVMNKRIVDMNKCITFDNTFKSSDIDQLISNGIIGNNNNNNINSNVVQIPPLLPRPLVTISNHMCNLDDPILWGRLLPFDTLCNPIHMRWTLAASNILFTNPIYSKIFTLGKCIKTIRGDGVFQDAIDIGIEKLENGQWVHLFPEAKVNQSDELLRFKWGIGRMIAESKVSPLILPIYHTGLDKSMPLGKLPIPRVFKSIDITIGKPFTCDHLLNTEIDQQTKQQLLDNMTLPYRQDPRYLRYKLITDHIESKFKQLLDFSKTLK